MVSHNFAICDRTKEVVLSQILDQDEKHLIDGLHYAERA